MKMIKTIRILSTTLLLATVSFFANAEAQTVLTVNEVTPEYPASALRRDKSGYVSIRFDVNENGKAHNITVVEAYPDKSFNSSAIKAVKRSSFVVMEGDSVLESSSAQNIERIYRFDNPTADKASRTVTMN